MRDKVVSNLFFYLHKFLQKMQYFSCTRKRLMHM